MWRYSRINYNLKNEIKNSFILKNLGFNNNDSLLYKSEDHCIKSCYQYDGDGFLDQYLREIFDYQNDFCDIELGTYMKYNRLDLVKKHIQNKEGDFYFLCKFNNVEIISWFLSQPHIQLQKKDENYNDDKIDIECAINIAAYYHANKVLKYLFTIQQSTGDALLIASLSKNNQGAKLLLENGVDVNSINSVQFVIACASNNIELFELLLQYNVNIYTGGECEQYNDTGNEYEYMYKNDAFRKAVEYNSINIIKRLEEIDIDTLYSIYCLNGDLDNVKEYYTKITNHSNDIKHACFSKNLNLVKYLVSLGNKPTDNCFNEWIKEDIADYLIESDCKPDLNIIISRSYYDELDFKIKLLSVEYKIKEYLMISLRQKLYYSFDQDYKIIKHFNIGIKVLDKILEENKDSLDFQQLRTNVENLKNKVVMDARKNTKILFCEWMDQIIECLTSSESDKKNAVVLKCALQNGALDGHEGRYIYMIEGTVFPRTYSDIQGFGRDPEFVGGNKDGRVYFIPDQEFFVVSR